MPVTAAVHDGLDGEFLLLDFDEARSIGYIEYPTGVIYVQDQDQMGRNFCLSESDSADAIVACIETLKTSSED